MTAFDEVFVLVARHALGADVVVTAAMHVRFCKPVVPGVPLVVQASPCESRPAGRSVAVRGVAHLPVAPEGEVVVAAEADGVFVAARPGWGDPCPGAEREES